jgi:hypothetical protein
VIRITMSGALESGYDSTRLAVRGRGSRALVPGRPDESPPGVPGYVAFVSLKTAVIDVLGASMGRSLTRRTVRRTLTAV